jgi:hypothetical protein
MQNCTTQGLWNAREVNIIIDKFIMCLLCCKAVQNSNKLLWTLCIFTQNSISLSPCRRQRGSHDAIHAGRMQSQLVTSSTKADTTLTLMRNLYKLDNSELMQKGEMYKLQELNAICLQHDAALS